MAPQPPATEIARTTPGSSLRVPLPDLPQTADAGDSKSVPSTLDLWLDGVSDAVSGATSKIRQAPPAAPVEVKHVDAKSPTVSDPSSLSCHRADAGDEHGLRREAQDQAGIHRQKRRHHHRDFKQDIWHARQARHRRDRRGQSEGAERRQLAPRGAKLVIPELPADKFEAATFPPTGRSVKDDQLAARSTPTKTDADNTPEAPRSTRAPVTKRRHGETHRRTVRRPRPACRRFGNTGFSSGADKAADSNKGDTMLAKADEKSAAAKSDASRMHTMRDKETLGDLARKYLGSSSRWKEIYKLNQSRYPDPSKIPAGAQIAIPAVASAKP